ncbi:MAG: YheC/YheD family protein [Alicyclobacillus sp.]|nr:YheC/YheD family protein [Alicyclobacillus sp.]
MARERVGELVWVQTGGDIRMFLYADRELRGADGGRPRVRVSNLTVPWVARLPKGRVLYRVPIPQEPGALPVFAILAGNRHFTGSRANFRDILRVAREQRAFVYVLPPDAVTDADVWTGFVRVARNRWIPIPCPRPEVVYNRIPNRALERTRSAVAAKATLARLEIPLFNPDYFNKWEIYEIVQRAGLSRYLPETHGRLTKSGFLRMLRRHRSLYLKPSGGSVGHGIIRVDADGDEWLVRVLKAAACTPHHARSPQEAWAVVHRHKLPGRYVLQATVDRIEWRGHPCDFRALAQKSDGDWTVVGKGVRVAGANAVATHVPNGGSIAARQEVLEGAFGSDWERIDQRMDEMILRLARAIDDHYAGRLGEMSMDIGVDAKGRPWLFEVNAKPMKFDEPDIRRRSLEGLLHHMQELRDQRGFR